jgi:acid phosphatase family membrane protein YuiD
MKKLSVIFVAFVLTVFIFSASGAEIKNGTPSQAVKTFFISMAKADLTTAEKVVGNKEIAAMLKMINDVIKETPEYKNELLKEFAGYDKVEIISEKISGNSAIVVVKYPAQGKTEKMTLKLSKVAGGWKIVESY